MGIHFKPIELSLKKNNMNCFFLLKNKGQKALQYPKNDGCDSAYELTIGIDGGAFGYELIGTDLPICHKHLIIILLMLFCQS